MLGIGKFPHGHQHDSIGREMAENKEFRFRASVCIAKSDKREKKRKRKKSLINGKNKSEREMKKWIKREVDKRYIVPTKTKNEKN